MLIERKYLERVEARIHELEAAMSQPGAASDSRRFKEMVREHTQQSELRAKAGAYFKLLDLEEEAQTILRDASADADLQQVAREELQGVEAALPAAEKALMLVMIPPDPEDSRNTIMEIRAGTGGEEAALFAADLYRMYTKYAERRGWRTGVMDANPSAIGGYKEIVFSIEGTDVYKTLRYESGGHRVQRVPETEAQGRIHTSAATVAVLPEVEEIDEVEIKPEELRIDLFCASGPGGQKVNKTESAIRITHLPSGIVVQSQDERSQNRNREKAMRVLAARLLDRKRAEEQQKYAHERRAQIGSGDRSERIRTYNYPQNRITDHRINLTLYALDRIVEGELDELVNALQARNVELRLAEMTKASDPMMG